MTEPTQQPSTATTRWGEWYVHYPVGFDQGYVLDCKTCGDAWPCAKATEQAKGSAEKEAKQSTLVENGRTPCLVDDDGGVCGRDDCPRCSGRTGADS